jgi:D-alanyl-D-alanine carboxypeptidase
MKGEMRFPIILALVLLSASGAARAACDVGPAAAAAANAASLTTLAWSPFRRPEVGWEIYAPRVAVEIGTICGPATPAFAAALQRWQAANKMVPTGVLDVPTFAAMNTRWTLSRRFVQQMRGGACPEPPAATALATATPAESYGGKTIQLRSDALAQWRRLVTAIRHDNPGLARDPRWLTIFSGFRLPLDDDVRCMIDNNCQGVTRANCSAHRTGLAMDVYVGQAVGLRPDSSDDANRRFMASTTVYRWLVTNAGRFGFANYVFEPWHWEWNDPAAAPPPAPPAKAVPPAPPKR